MLLIKGIIYTFILRIQKSVERGQRKGPLGTNGKVEE